MIKVEKYKDRPSPPYHAKDYKNKSLIINIKSKLKFLNGYKVTIPLNKLKIEPLFDDKYMVIIFNYDKRKFK